MGLSVMNMPAQGPPSSLSLLSRRSGCRAGVPEHTTLHSSDRAFLLYSSVHRPGAASTPVLGTATPVTGSSPLGRGG